MVTQISASYGRRAYEAYLTYAHGRSLVSGAVLPTWEDLDDEIKGAWVATASAVLSGVTVPNDDQ